MLKKLLLPAIIAAIGIAAMALLVIAQPKPVPRAVEEEPARIQVTVVPAKHQVLHLAVEAQGTVRPKREIDLVAQVSGQVVEVDPAFVDGGFFDAGQPLLRIDEREYRAALSSARARVADAEQRLAEERGRSLQAEREWRDLGNQSANDLFLRKPQMASAQANLESARGDLEVAELNLERTRISVPFKGRVRQTRANLGQYVTAGTPLATVYDSTLVEVRLPLTESQATLIDLPLTPGATERVPVTITGSVAGEPHQWQGVLARTDAFVDPDSRLYYAVVEVADPFSVDSVDQASGKQGAPLLPGLFVSAEIQGKRLDGVLKLPRAALFERDKLLTLDEENNIAQHKVQVLRRSETHVWIKADIPEDTLISLDKHSLTPAGTSVEPRFSDGTAPGSGTPATADASSTAIKSGE
ncbi:efflux RND transporter periplasmic adaptor subunit [Marinimicrobium sp. C2-29]|uniref:efflux RND transporter periplasmic adaptor subunit n=1 Tax=Marinimicrobium sp. C2-29 TaxID=3139825 RepID=UPI00313A1D49